VGVCVRNCGLTIRDAIESIFVQDYPHDLIEIIFVDDGSEDATLSIIYEYMQKIDTKAKVFHHNWRGLGYSRNLVLQNASGKYIIWVDGDMVLSKNFITNQVEFMEKNPKIAVAVGHFRGLEQNGVVSTLENIEWLVLNYLAEKDGKIKENLHFCGGSIYRTLAIKDVGGFNSNIRGAGEDKEIIFRLKRAGWSISQNSNAVFYEKRKNSWKALWNQYFWYGYSAGYMSNEYKKNITPSVSNLFLPFLYIKIAYTLTKKKIVFLMLLQYCFKYLASFFGLINAIIEK
jgi:glycosyltransferase involved in cell wall biosynthesis